MLRARVGGVTRERGAGDREQVGAAEDFVAALLGDVTDEPEELGCVFGGEAGVVVRLMIARGVTPAEASGPACSGPIPERTKAEKS